MIMTLLVMLIKELMVKSLRMIAVLLCLLMMGCIKLVLLLLLLVDG